MLKPILDLVIGKLLIWNNLVGTTWTCELTFSTVNFMKPKYRSDISGENLVIKLECVVSVKYTLGFKDLI